MDTRTLIEASATVIQIASFKPGDVYKRLVTTSGEHKLVFGVVTSLMNNGTDGAFSALELTDNYGTAKLSNAVVAAGSGVALFPATPDEFEVAVREHIEKSERMVQDAARALDTRQKELDALQHFAANAEISAPLTKGADVVQGELEVGAES